MKGKASLSLMELAIMILVFAIASAVCIRIFVYADTLSTASAVRSEAALHAQNTAEIIKLCRGDFGKASASISGSKYDGRVLNAVYDKEWNPDDSGVYIISAYLHPTQQPLLGAADISVSTLEGNVLFSLTVAWQEVSTLE